MAKYGFLGYDWRKVDTWRESEVKLDNIWIVSAKTMDAHYDFTYFNLHAFF